MWMIRGRYRERTQMAGLFAVMYCCVVQYANSESVEQVVNYLN